MANDIICNCWRFYKGGMGGWVELMAYRQRENGLD